MMKKEVKTDAIAEVLSLGECTGEEAGETHEEWLAARRRGIGGSDAGVVISAAAGLFVPWEVAPAFRLNQWLEPFELFYDKKGLLEERDGEAMARGRLYEARIRRWCELEFAVKIAEPKCAFVSKAHPFMRANLDGVFFAEKETEIPDTGERVAGLVGHEIKTSARGEGFDFEGGEIPDSYFAQVQHYMAVTGLKTFVLTALYGARLNHFIIPRDEDFIQSLIRAEERFWTSYVEANVAPSPLGSREALSLAKGLPTAETVALPPDAASLFEERERLDSEIKEREARKNELETRIFSAVYSASPASECAKKTVATCGEWSLTVTRSEAKTVDTDKLKKAGLFDEYSKTSKRTLSKFKREEA